jgi:hypothetical protein
VVGTGEAVGEMTVTTPDTITRFDHNFRQEGFNGNYRVDLDIPGPDNEANDDPFDYGVDEAEEVFNNAIRGAEEVENQLSDFLGR